MIFLSRDGKCLWDASGESIDAEGNPIIYLSAHDLAQAFALIHGVYARAAARLPFRFSMTAPTAGCDCTGPDF